MTMIEYARQYGEMQKAKDEKLMNKANLKLFRVTDKVGYEREVFASSKADARKLSKMTCIVRVEAVS